ncbi:hypothetical protein A3Q56_05608 [Intoshia linei]|uniref:Uncharacterized protein n=1 Tax=Intoshia linei TaxID=1819745 RepID=A0A177AZS8_9BILA|nr:hypothetical protein A3Q56_05608 [Intoshia linei]
MIALNAICCGELKNKNLQKKIPVNKILCFGQYKETVLLKSLCYGSQLPKSIHSYSNQMYITFPKNLSIASDYGIHYKTVNKAGLRCSRSQIITVQYPRERMIMSESILGQDKACYIFVPDKPKSQIFMKFTFGELGKNLFKRMEPLPPPKNQIQNNTIVGKQTLINTEFEVDKIDNVDAKEMEVDLFKMSDMEMVVAYQNDAGNKLEICDGTDARINAYDKNQVNSISQNGISSIFSGAKATDFESDKSYYDCINGLCEYVEPKSVNISSYLWIGFGVANGFISIFIFIGCYCKKKKKCNAITQPTAQLNTQSPSTQQNQINGNDTTVYGVPPAPVYSVFSNVSPPPMMTTQTYSKLSKYLIKEFGRIIVGILSEFENLDRTLANSLEKSKKT